MLFPIYVLHVVFVNKYCPRNDTPDIFMTADDEVRESDVW